MRARALTNALSALLLAASCGAPKAPTEVVLAEAPKPSAAPPASSAPPPARRGPSAIDVARLQGARIFAVVEVAALRDHQLATRLDPMLPFRRSLTTAGIDPRHEIDRILLADSSLRHHAGAMTIWQHHIDPARIDAFLTAATDESEPSGRRFALGDRPCAVLHHRHLTGTACAASSSLLVVALDPSEALLTSLAGSVGVPAPPPGEAAHVTFLDPSRTLDLGTIRPPEGLRKVEIGVKTASVGGLDVEIVAPSDDPARDAALLAALLQSPEAMLHVGPLPVPPPAIRFSAVGGDVVGSMPITKDDLDALTSLLTLAIPF